MYLVVGCGLSGVVIAERIASVLKEKVLIIDRRNHIGGNIYDYQDKNGILIHKYGPHAFHTNNREVWKYLSNFTDWHIYFHKVKAKVDGVEIPLPFNLNSLYEVFSKTYATKLEDKLIKKYGMNAKIGILDLLNDENTDIKNLSQYIYEKVFLGYTKKQWGVLPEELDKAVTSRVPIYVSRDNRYFQDKYQAVPKKGYTEMIKNMISNPLIEIQLNTDFKEVSNLRKYKKIFYTGSIDEYFDYDFGELPYRSLRFDFKTFNQEYFQSACQINYPVGSDFTRITEYKYFLNQATNKTTVSFEYPQEYICSKNEPFYPIPKIENKSIYEKYSDLSRKEENTVFLGRLGEYKYYNMDQVVENAIKIFRGIV